MVSKKYFICLAGFYNKDREGVSRIEGKRFPLTNYFFNLLYNIED